MNQNETIQLKSALRKEQSNSIYDKDDSDNELDDFFADDSFEDTCDPSSFSRGDRSSLKSRSIYTNHTGDLSKKCNLFPCGNLRSYTSMTGSEKDRKKERTFRKESKVDGEKKREREHAKARGRQWKMG